MSDNYFLELFIIVINFSPIFYNCYKQQVKILEETANGNQYERTFRQQPTVLFITHTHKNKENSHHIVVSLFITTRSATHWFLVLRLISSNYHWLGSSWARSEEQTFFRVEQEQPRTYILSFVVVANYCLYLWGFLLSVVVHINIILLLVIVNRRGWSCVS